MPFVSLNTPTGEVEMAYVISTPTSASADTITPGLPCILFLHAEWASKEIFEAQFSDPQLREKFNMIALDLRAQGETTGPVKKGVYTLEAAAEDVYHFMKAMNLPPVHFFGVSIGTYIGIHLAANHPELVSSLTLCSHIPEVEPQESLEGRMQFVEFLAASFRMDSKPITSDSVNSEYLSELVQGGLAFLYSSIENKLTEPLINKLVLYAAQNWGVSPEHLAQVRVIAIDWIADNKELDIATLSKFKCPVSIIHSKGDIAYGGDIKHLEEFASRLRKAGQKDVTLHQIEGSHYAMVTHPREVNEIIIKQVTAAVQGKSYSAIDFRTSRPERPPFPSPFAEELAQYGYHTDPNLAFENSYPSTEFGVRTLIEDHLPN